MNNTLSRKALNHDGRYDIASHVSNPKKGALTRISKSSQQLIDKLDIDLVTVVTKCKTHGEMSVSMLKKDVIDPNNTPCQKCKWDADAYKERLNNLRERVIANLDMPREHIGKSFKDWMLMGDATLRERQALIVSRMAEYANSYGVGSKNILMTGNTGTGKTKLACLIANTILNKRFTATTTVLYKRSSDIQDEIKATWDKFSKDNAQAYIERVSKATVLILDEVGQADITSDNDRERLSAIIDRRYQLGLPTIITTNLTEDQFYRHVGDRAKDRLRQRLIKIDCTWPSYRAVFRDEEVL